MKKSIVLTLLILLVFTTGCGLMPGTELYLSQTLNILGLWSVYYKTGRITFKFDESYAHTGEIINIDEWCAIKLRCNSYISDF